MNGETNGNPGKEEDSPFLPSDVRSLFPGVEDKVYFNVAVRGLIPQAVAEVAHAHVEEALRATSMRQKSTTATPSPSC